MRIAISCPDSLGDLILREPLFKTLGEAGHALLLLVRPDVFALARHVVPSAQFVVMPVNPYGISPFDSPAELGSAFETARAFGPDLLVLAPYEWTMFEEHLAAALRDVPAVGLNGGLCAGLHYPSAVRLARQAAVPRDLHEWDKNRRLCELILGRPPVWGPPRITPTSDQLRQAESRLAQQGLTPNGYWVASIGEDPGLRHSHLRNWTAEGWVAVLRHAVRTHGYCFLLIGSDAEQDYNRQLQNSLGAEGDHVKLLKPEGIDLLVGVSALAQGYLGRDTGPMHLAAALRKPVVALFGGGTWPRFIPVAETARVLTTRSPCRSCDWDCPLADSECVKSIPADAVMAAVDEIAGGQRGQVTIREGPYEPGYVETMARQMAEVARQASQLVKERTCQVGVVNAYLQEAQQNLAEARQMAQALVQERDLLRCQLDQARSQFASPTGSLWRKLGRALKVIRPRSPKE